MFTITNLINQRVVVNGTDINGVTGSEVLDSSQWEELVALTELQDKADSFDEAVLAFFAPLLEAAENVKSVPVEDDLSYVVLNPAVEAVEGESEVRVNLTRDSIIIRLVESGDTSRLIWIEGELHILALPKEAGQPEVMDEVLPFDSAF